MEAPPVSGRLYSGEICQLEKPIRGNPGAETPPFRITGLEIGECLAADRVHQEIAWLAVQRSGGPGQPATELLELRFIHDGPNAGKER